MTFALRGILVSLAFFAVVYCLGSSLVVLAWRGIRCVGCRPSASSANVLFGLRIIPIACAVGISVFFTFPSFWLLERASLDEDTGTFVLGVCSILILGIGLFRALQAEAKTRHVVSKWGLAADIRDTGAITSTIKAADGAPPLILVGIRRPRVMVSDVAATLLSGDELQVAIRHELGHMRAWDNLKRVLISATPFPGMSSLERAWREAAELAADESAATNRREALDLAVALIKLSKLFQQWNEPALATGLVTKSSSISLRVARLIEWREDGRGLRRHTWPRMTLVLLTTSAAVTGHYSMALAITHRLTELFVP